jgi:hypothetical protein
MIATLLPFAVLLACAVPWLLLVGRRFGHTIGVLSVITVGPLLVLVSFHVSQLLSADPVWVTLVAAIGAGVGGTVVLAVRRGVALRPSRAAVATWLASCAGLAAWLGTLLVSPLVGGSIRGWAMFGDAGNNIAISRGMLSGHGYPFTALQAVPLPNELLSIGMWANRTGTAGQLMAHDLYALAVMGAIAIGATGIAIGAVASSLLPPTRPGLIALVSALGSLASATWFVAGLPLESGYYNVHVVLPFALVSWLAYLRSRQHPVAAALLLAGLTLVIAASWAPLVVVPAGFGLALLLRYRATAQGRRRLLPSLVILGAVAVAAIAGLALPAATRTDFLGLLASPGHGFPSTIPVLLIGALGAVLLATRAERGGVLTLALAALAGLGVLIAVNADAAEPWMPYYPAKYTWLVTVVVVAVLLAVAVRRLATTRAPLLGPVAAASALVLVATLGPAPHRENFTVEQPLDRILTDSVLSQGEASIDAIIAYADSPEIIVQWGTGSPDEAFVNFWALEFKGTAPNIAGNHGRIYTVAFYRELRDSGTFVTPPAETLCRLVATLDDSATVHTRDRSLADTLEAACPEIDFTVTVDQ